MIEQDRSDVFTEIWKLGVKAFGDMNVFASKFGVAAITVPGFPVPTSETTNQFKDLMDACLKATSGITSGTGAQAGEASNAAFLQRLFDPREWLQSTGFADDATRRLAEAPTLADLWQVERKYSALMQAWADVRSAGAEHNTHLLQAWAQATAELAASLKETADAGGAIKRRDLVDRWVAIANRHLISTQGTDAFLETQRRLIKATTDLRTAQRDLTEHYSEMFGMPTRADFDDLVRIVSDLRREVRSGAQRQAANGVA